MTTPLNKPKHESVQQELITGWGSRLRETRLARNISLEKIAEQLHLDLKLLESIEAEDIDRLPSPAFVKGYLRNYARMLDIDHEPILAVYNDLNISELPNISRVMRVKEMSSNDKASRYTTWIVAAVTVMSLLVWWSDMLMPNKEHDDNSVVSDESKTAIKSSVLVDVVPVEANTVVPAVEENFVEESIASPIGFIKLQFKKDSWVEITDSNEKRLFLNIGKEGQSRTVEGVPPFKILLGNSKEVIMEYNGELFDHRIYESKNIARFTLDN